MHDEGGNIKGAKIKFNSRINVMSTPFHRFTRRLKPKDVQNPSKPGEFTISTSWLFQAAQDFAGLEILEEKLVGTTTRLQGHTRTYIFIKAQDDPKPRAGDLEMLTCLC